MKRFHYFFSSGVLLHPTHRKMESCYCRLYSPLFQQLKSEIIIFVSWIHRRLFSPARMFFSLSRPLSRPLSLSLSRSLNEINAMCFLQRCLSEATAEIGSAEFTTQDARLLTACNGPLSWNPEPEISTFQSSQNVDFSPINRNRTPLLPPSVAACLTTYQVNFSNAHDL